MPKKKYTQKQIDSCVAWREKGMSIAAAAHMAGMHPKSADYHCRKVGAFPPGWKHQGDRRTRRSYVDKNGRTVTEFSDQDDARITAMSIAGKTVGEIAKAIGRPRNSTLGRLTALANREECA